MWGLARSGAARVREQTQKVIGRNMYKLLVAFVFFGPGRLKRLESVTLAYFTILNEYHAVKRSKMKAKYDVIKNTKFSVPTSEVRHGNWNTRR